MNKIKALFQIGKNLALSQTALSTYFVFTGNISSAFFAFLFTVLLLRVPTFSYADFGYYSAMLSLLLLVTDVADIGIGSSLSAFLPRMENTIQNLLRFLKAAFLSQTSIAIVLTLVVFIFSRSLSDILFHDPSFEFLLKVTSFGIFFTIMAQFFQSALAARQRFRQVAILSVWGGLIRLFLLIILLVFSLVSLNSVVWIQTLALLGLMLGAIVFLKIDFLKARTIKDDFKKLLLFSYLLGIARGATAIASRLDVLMIVSLLGKNMGPTEAGIYAIASRVISIYPLLTGSFSTVIAPKFSVTTNVANLKNFLIKVILATLAIIGTVIFFIIIAPWFMELLFGEKGKTATSIFQVLLVSMIFFVASIPAVSLAIYYLKKPQILTYNGILQLVIVVIGNFLFIPNLGRFGAAVSLIIAYGVSLLLTTFLTFYYYKKIYAK